MKEPESKKPSIVGSDIVFDCSHCGKSLVIDCRGAGLNIICPQCNSELEVPIPEGFDLADLDKAITSSVESDSTKIRIAQTGAGEEEAGESTAAGTPTDDGGGLASKLEEMRLRHEELSREHERLVKSIRNVASQVRDLHELVAGLERQIESSGPAARRP